MATQFHTYSRDITAFMCDNANELMFYLNECLRYSNKNIDQLMSIQNQIPNSAYANILINLRTFTFKRGLLNG